MATKPLTEKAKNFAKIYATNWFHWRKAYKEAYGQLDDIKAWVSAYQLLKDKRVQDEIELHIGEFKSIGYKVGMTKEFMVKTLFEMMNAVKPWKDGQMYPDWIARNNAIASFAKLTGDIVDKSLKKKEEEEKPKDAAEEAEIKDLSKLEWDELIRERERILSKMTIVDVWK